MKMLLKLSAIVCGLFLASSAFADGGACCAAQQPDNCQDQATGECWCKYVHWEACPYTTSRCVEVQVPCQRQCCRYVPRYCEVQCCRWVPQYCTVACCCYEPEYYCAPDCKTCTQTVCDTHCRYVPQCYWKKVCCQSEVCAPAGY